MPIAGSPGDFGKLIADRVTVATIHKLRSVNPTRCRNAEFRKGGTELGYLDGPDFAKFLEADTARLLSVARKIKLSS